jgi:hypothetical protein
VTECDVYPRAMRRIIEIAGQCSQQDCLSRYQILLCSLLNEELIGVDLAFCLKAYQVGKGLAILYFISAVQTLYDWSVMKARSGGLPTYFETKHL